ncbi:MAG: hypothetical protein ACQKBY_07925 [Verrucomicrobiales bacterium]
MIRTARWRIGGWRWGLERAATPSFPGIGRKNALLFLLPALLGFALGYQAKQSRLSPSPGAEPSPNSETRAAPTRRPSSHPSRRERQEFAHDTPSALNLDDILALPDSEDDVYAPLALWLTDASAEEIATYWNHLQQNEKINSNLAKLIMANWTQLDPQAALAAAEGTYYIRHVWSSWAANDPEQALAAALATKSPDHVGSVAWGLAEFRPAWFRENYEKIPADRRRSAWRGYQHANDLSDPLAALEFAREHKLPNKLREKSLQALAREDPLAAFEWIRNQPLNYQNGLLFDSLLDSLALASPRELSLITSMATNPERKSRLEFLLFKQELSEDPAAAEARLAAVKAPIQRDNMRIALAEHHLRDHPEKALKLVTELFKNDSAIHFYGHQGFSRSANFIASPDGSRSGSVQKIDGLDSVVSKLLESHPQEFMNELTAATAQSGESKQSFNTLSSYWAKQDLNSFQAHSRNLSDPSLQERANKIITRELSQRREHRAALDFALKQPKADTALFWRPYQNWLQEDPTAASEWLSSTELPTQIKNDLSGLKPFDHQNSLP